MKGYFSQIRPKARLGPVPSAFWKRHRVTLCDYLTTERRSTWRLPPLWLLRLSLLGTVSVLSHDGRGMNSQLDRTT